MRVSARLRILFCLLVLTGAALAAQTPAGQLRRPGLVAVHATTPIDLREWDTRINQMVRGNQLVVLSARADPDISGRTHESLAQVPPGHSGLRRKPVPPDRAGGLGLHHWHRVRECVRRFLHGDERQPDRAGARGSSGRSARRRCAALRDHLKHQVACRCRGAADARDVRLLALGLRLSAQSPKPKAQSPKPRDQRPEPSGRRSCPHRPCSRCLGTSPPAGTDRAAACAPPSRARRATRARRSAPRHARPSVA